MRAMWRRIGIGAAIAAAAIGGVVGLYAMAHALPNAALRGARERVRDEAVYRLSRESWAIMEAGSYIGGDLALWNKVYPLQEDEPFEFGKRLLTDEERRLAEASAAWVQRFASDPLDPDSTYSIDVEHHPPGDAYNGLKPYGYTDYYDISWNPISGANVFIDAETHDLIGVRFEGIPAIEWTRWAFAGAYEPLFARLSGWSEADIDRIRRIVQNWEREDRLEHDRACERAALAYMQAHGFATDIAYAWPVAPFVPYDPVNMHIDTPDFEYSYRQPDGRWVSVMIAPGMEPRACSIWFYKKGLSPLGSDARGNDDGGEAVRP